MSTRVDTGPGYSGPGNAPGKYDDESSTTDFELKLMSAASPNFPEPDLVRLGLDTYDNLAGLYVYEWNSQAVQVNLTSIELRALGQAALELADEMEAGA